MQIPIAPRGTLYVLFDPIRSKVQGISTDLTEVQKILRDPLVNQPLGVEVYRDGQHVKTRLFHVSRNQLN